MTTRDLLPFTVMNDRPTTLATLTQLRHLAERLIVAEQFVNAVKKRSHAWGVPRLFFFHSECTPHAPREDQNLCNCQLPTDGRSPILTRSVRSTFLSGQRFDDSSDALRTAREMPALALAWVSIGELVEDAFTLAAENVQVRHLARAVPQLHIQLRKLGEHHESCRHFAQLLDVLDDAVITVLVPEQRRGWKVLVRGIADVGQFQQHFAEISANRWQFYKPAALQPDGTLPTGFAGNSHWLWDSQPLRERLLLAGPQLYSRDTLRKFAAVIGEVEVLETFSPKAVTQQLETKAGGSVPRMDSRKAA